MRRITFNIEDELRRFISSNINQFICIFALLLGWLEIGIV